MSISETLLPEFEQEMTNARKILAAVPEDNLSWKPHEKSMTLGRLAGHVAELAQWAVHTLTLDSLDISPDAEGKYPGYSMTSRAALLEKFDQSVNEAKAALAATPDAAYSKIWSLTSQGHTFLSMPRSAVLRFVVMNHMIHHRGQLTVYLRLNGVSFPGVYGPSADEQFAFAATNSENH